MIDQVITLCLMAIASGTIALVLTSSHMTRPLRHEWIDAPWMLGELINCPYCMSFWTGIPFGMADAYFRSGGGAVTNYLVIVGLSHIFMGIVLRLFLFRESENEELRDMIRESREALHDLMEKKDGEA